MTTRANDKKVFREQMEEEKDKPRKKGASADGAKWGLLLTPQFGKSNRIDTFLENGFESELKGLALGVDYLVTDQLVIGTVLGHVRDKAVLLNAAGSLETQNSSLLFYTTWMPSDSVAFDAYAGIGKTQLKTQRQVIAGSINGATTAETPGQQLLAGLSASYQKDFGGINISPFIAVDGIKTKFDAYDETGATTLEFHYDKRETESFTSSLGARVGTTHSLNWGTLMPYLRLAAVHEYKNDSAQIKNELVIAPGSGFLVATDEPDRNYFNVGAGAALALDHGHQVFVNYEKRVQDELLSSWAVSVGVLINF